MIIRTKTGELKNGNTSSLLEYLGVKKDTAGVHKLTEEIELIAPVPFCLSAENEGSSFAWTLSTFDLDRFGERVDPQGWDFKRYLQNPVVEWAHRYDIPAIGKMDNLKIDDNGLHGVVFFNDKSFDPFAWSIEQRVKTGVIRAGSVGFRVIEIEIPDRKTQEEGTFLIFRKQELLEFSICNVPANPFALAKNNEQAKEEKSNIISPFWGNFINNF
jgi:HK97 family phage prohead protease